MRVHHRLQPQSTLRIGMNEARLDRTRTDQRDLHHDVVQMIRLRVQDRIDLRPTLDLEHADRLAALNQIVRLRIRVVDTVHLGTRARALLDHVIRNPHHRQRAQSQEVELRHADHIQVILVVLDDRAPHRRLLHRQIASQRLARQHEAAHMRRTQPRQPVERRQRGQQRPAARVVQIHTPRLGHLSHGVDTITRFVAVHAFRDL